MIKSLPSERDLSSKLAARCREKRRLDDNEMDRKTQTVIGCQRRNSAGIGYAINHEAKIADKDAGIGHQPIGQGVRHATLISVYITIGAEVEIVAGLPRIIYRVISRSCTYKGRVGYQRPLAA